MRRELRRSELSKREKLRPRGGHESDVKAPEGHEDEVKAQDEGGGRCEFNA